MFIPHKYGTKKVLLGIYEPYPFHCPNCRQLNSVEFAVFGEYYHFWYIPIFPFEKDGIATCSNCNFSIGSLKYSNKTKEEFKEIAGKFKYPIYTYIGATLFLLPMAIGIISILIEVIT